MKRETKYRELRPSTSQRMASVTLGSKAIFFAVMAGVALFSACSNISKSSENSGPLSGNWQFQIQVPDSSFSSPGQNCGQPQSGTALCAGGLLLQKSEAVSGQAQYSIVIPSPPPDKPFCNSGSATVTGTVNGQNVTLSLLAGPETFTLTGSLSSDGSTMTGSYTSTGMGCGNAQSGSTWTATRVPALTGAVQGSFHSTSGSNTALRDQAFPVTGFLTQGPNNGATSASITGTLNFQGYPCLTTASVNGAISGNSVILQIIAPNGLTVGQIGEPPGPSSTIFPVIFNSSSGGNILRGTRGYGLSTKSCKGGVGFTGDIGNICLGVGNTNACTQPISLTPASLTFPVQLLGSSPTSQSFTVTNTDPSGNALDLQLTFPGGGSTPSDFNGTPHFQGQDNCATSAGSTFTLASQQSCVVTISFSPQQSCPWLPSVAAPSSCPPFLAASVGSPPALSAQLTVSCLNCATGVDNDTNFAGHVSGVGVSAIQPSTPELDFGAEKAADATGAGGEATLPQTVSFTNQGSSSVQILPATNPICVGGLRPRPAIAGVVPGLQVVTNNNLNLAGTPQTVQYLCDLDQGIGGQGGTNKPNFRITSDDCSGFVLVPQQSCSIAITYTPQPNEADVALDYFLELNTTECTGTVTANCEIDSGRFPVELKSNGGSPLRMSPGAGLDFGPQLQGQTSAPLTITLRNDPTVANPVTVTFTGKVITGDYAETDDCGVSLTPGSSCTLSITFTPTAPGFRQGNIVITNSATGYAPTQTVYMRGFGQ